MQPKPSRAGHGHKAPCAGQHGQGDAAAFREPLVGAGADQGFVAAPLPAQPAATATSQPPVAAQRALARITFRRTPNTTTPTSTMHTPTPPPKPPLAPPRPAPPAPPPQKCAALSAPAAPRLPTAAAATSHSPPARAPTHRTVSNATTPTTRYAPSHTPHTKHATTSAPTRRDAAGSTARRVRAHATVGAGRRRRANWYTPPHRPFRGGGNTSDPAVARTASDLPEPPNRHLTAQVCRETTARPPLRYHTRGRDAHAAGPATRRAAASSRTPSPLVTLCPGGPFLSGTMAYRQNIQHRDLAKPGEKSR